MKRTWTWNDPSVEGLEGQESCACEAAASHALDSDGVLSPYHELPLCVGLEGTAKSAETLHGPLEKEVVAFWEAALSLLVAALQEA
mmetsp:Transcript_4898/g.13594  ORF Transcript_4898/g.13594 Transcript_4898/m.13594 type:complete len:86 (-) Transcript_4898:113-370(-)